MSKYNMLFRKLPRNLRNYLKRKKADFKYVSECAMCEKETLLVFYVDNAENPGTFEVCANPECFNFAELSWYPMKGGR